MQINFGAKIVNCKIVYYGPGFSGKTTNIQKIHEQMPGDRRGDLTSIKTDGDRTLFFDFMALDLGTVAGMDIRFQIYTVPGQAYYHATRKLVLQGADGVVFVADSAPDRMQANIDSWQDLEHNLAERGLTLHDVPVVVQWNKRDLSDVLPTDEMDRRINSCRAPSFEAVACRGDGVLNTLKCVCSLVCKSVGASQIRPCVPSEAALAAAKVPAAAQPRPLSASEMRFVPRRAYVGAASATGAPSEPAGPATAVAEREAAVRTLEPIRQSPKEEAPVPPASKRPTSPVAVELRREPSRSVWVWVLAASLLLAAAIGVGMVLDLLKTW